MSRLNTLREYLRLAELQPEENKLYIEDLKASIVYEEQRTKTISDFVIGKGFDYARS